MDPYPCNRVIANVLFKTSYLESWGNTENYYIKTSVLHLRSNCIPFASQMYSFCIAKGIHLECKYSTFASHLTRPDITSHCLVNYY